MHVRLFELLILILMTRTMIHEVHGLKKKSKKVLEIEAALPTQTSFTKYVPPLVEKRVWTNTFADPIALETRIPMRRMDLTLRDFATNCDGYCLYHLGNATNKDEADCEPKSKNCLLAASIARHNPAHTCPYIKKASGKLNESLCEKDDVIYSVTLIRSILNDSCPSYWNFDKEMPCYPTEFVAIQFLDALNGSEVEHSQKFWYVCVAGEITVTYWERDEQKLFTEPIYGTAPGVIATTKLLVNPDSNTLVCQFLISSKSIQGNNLGEVTFDEESTNKIYIRMAQGRVTRNDSMPVPAELISSNKELQDEELHKQNLILYFENQFRVQHPNIIEEHIKPEDEYIITDKFIGPGFQTPEQGFFDLKLMTPAHEPLMKTVSDSEHKENERRIDKAIAECQEDRQNVLCFTPGKSRSCVFRKRCTLMAIVKPVAGSKFTKFHFTVIHFVSRKPQQKMIIRPHGYMSLGFSRDEKMGNDAVVTCKFAGDDARDITVSYNMPDTKNNILNLTVNQDIIFDKDPMIAVKYEYGDKMMCGWKMNAKFQLETTVYDRADKEHEKKVRAVKDTKIGSDGGDGGDYGDGGGDGHHDGDGGGGGYDGGEEEEPEEEPEPEHFEKFDLMQPSCKGTTYVLLAAGSQLFSDSSIGYHAFREFIRSPVLVKESFSKAAKPKNSSYHFILPGLILLLVDLYFIQYI